MIFVVLVEKVLNSVECNLETKGQKYIINICIGGIKNTDKQTVYFPLFHLCPLGSCQDLQLACPVGFLLNRTKIVPELSKRERLNVTVAEMAVFFWFSLLTVLPGEALT